MTIVKGSLEVLEVHFAGKMLAVFTLMSNTDFSYFHGLSSSLYKPLLLPLSFLLFHTVGKQLRVGYHFFTCHR